MPELDDTKDSTGGMSRSAEIEGSIINSTRREFRQEVVVTHHFDETSTSIMMPWFRPVQEPKSELEESKTGFTDLRHTIRAAYTFTGVVLTGSVTAVVLQPVAPVVAIATCACGSAVGLSRFLVVRASKKAKKPNK